jgi:transposase
MYTVELYAKVRCAVLVEGRSEPEVARLYGIHRATVRTMLQFSVPPGYRRQRDFPALPRCGWAAAPPRVKTIRQQPTLRGSHNSMSP